MALTLLIDQDGVLAHSEKAFLDSLRRKYPDKPFIPLEQRTTFFLEDQYPPEHHHAIPEIFSEKGFFYSFNPMPGSIEALAEMQRLGINAFICTSPSFDYPQCAFEKFQWIGDWHGMYWVKRTIITRDKTLVHGDILIDDNPEIKGARTPSWEHVLFTQPYNKDIQSKRRLTWSNWKEVLGIK